MTKKNRLKNLRVQLNPAVVSRPLMIRGKTTPPSPAPAVQNGARLSVSEQLSWLYNHDSQKTIPVAKPLF